MLFANSRNNNHNDNNSTVLAVNKARCPQNHPCPSIRVCPVGALKQTGYSAPVVDEDKCIKCGKCVSFCPMRALSLQ
jgi:Fe-S-cluster-containing hydrogenase component 2